MGRIIRVGDLVEVVFEIEDPKTLEDPVVNLLLNMSGGLLPEHLQPDEVELLRSKYGSNWFEELGYNDKEYRRPRNC